jgi:predicted nicotinamide N-methyase
MDFKTDEIELLIGDFNIQLTVINNIDELFDDLIQKGDEHEDVKDERIPYWAELWASAIGMSHYLVENALITEGVHVTEIGCGLGLPSIVAGKMGGNVIMTDYLKDALDFAELNWNKNLPHKKAQIAQLDWRNPNPSLSADILLASDVAYEARAFEPLLNAFKVLLKPNGRIIITEPNRPVSKEFFLQLDSLLKDKNTIEERNPEGSGNVVSYRLKHSSAEIERKGHVHKVNIYDLKSNS